MILRGLNWNLIFKGHKYTSLYKWPLNNDKSLSNNKNVFMIIMINNSKVIFIENEWY